MTGLLHRSPLARICGGMTADEPPAWWQRRISWAAILIVAILPLLWPPLPPLVDLPGHAARWHIAMADAASPLSRYYAIHWALIGNLGTDLLGIPLAHLVGVLAAAKLIIILIMLLTVIGMLWLSAEAHGRVAPTALFALPFAYGWPFQMGFANFLLAQALALCALALWLRLARTGRLRLRAAMSAPIATILWIAHSAGWGLFGLMAFGAELARLRELGRSWQASLGGATCACVPLAFPVLIMLTNGPQSSGASDSGDWFNFRAKILWVITSFHDRWAWFDIASLAPPLLILYVAARDRRLGYSSLLGGPALFCFGGFLLLPRLLFGGYYVDMRLVPAVWILALLAIRPPPGRFADGLAFLGAGFFAVRIAATTMSFALLARAQHNELAAVDHIPRGAAVLALVYRSCDTPWATIRGEHLPAYAIIARDAFTNEQWAIEGQQYLRIRYRAAGSFDSAPSQLVDPAGCKKELQDIDHAIATFPRRAFSHVWIIGYRPADPARSGLRPVWTNLRSTLYEVVGSPAAGRVDPRR